MVRVRTKLWLNQRDKTDLGDSKPSVPTGNHFVPLVVQQVHVPVWFVSADELGDVGAQRGALRKADAVTCRQETGNRKQEVHCITWHHVRSSGAQQTRKQQQTNNKWKIKKHKFLDNIWELCRIHRLYLFIYNFITKRAWNYCGFSLVHTGSHLSIQPQT